MNNASKHLSRDLQALRYLDALTAGDLEAVADIWEEADRDPELQGMLAEVDDALFVESKGDASPRREPSGRRRQRWAVWVGVAGGLAAACVIAVIAWQGRDVKDKAAIARTSEPDLRLPSHPPGDLISLAPRRDPDLIDLPVFAWPFENSISASSPLDRID